MLAVRQEEYEDLVEGVMAQLMMHSFRAWITNLRELENVQRQGPTRYAGEDAPKSYSFENTPTSESGSNGAVIMSSDPGLGIRLCR